MSDDLIRAYSIDLFFIALASVFLLAAFWMVEEQPSASGCAAMENRHE